jgi:hypothetical protein
VAEMHEEAHAALREQIARVIAAEHTRRADEQIAASPLDHARAFADAVMTLGEVSIEVDGSVGRLHLIPTLRIQHPPFVIADDVDAASGSAREETEEEDRG